RDGFRARVHGGPSIIKVEANDNQGNFFYGQAELNISSDVTGLRINVAPTKIPIISARHSVTEEALSDAAQQQPPYVRLIPLDPGLTEVSSQVHTENGNVTASIDRVQFGRYRVSLQESNWYPESMTYKGTDLRTE